MAQTEVLPYVLTPQRQRLLRFIGEFWQVNGYAPTARELTVDMGLASVSTTHTHLEIMRRNGLIEWETGRPRTIRLTESGRVRFEQMRVL